MITDINQIAQYVEDPGRSHFVNIYSPSGGRLFVREKPRNLKTFLDRTISRYQLPFVIVQLRAPNGTSTKKLGEARYPLASADHGNSMGVDRSPFGYYGSPYRSHGGYGEDMGVDRNPFGGYGSPYRNHSHWPVPAGADIMNGPMDRKTLVKVELFDEVKRERDRYKEQLEETKEKLLRLERKLELLELEKKFNENNSGNEIISEIVSAVAERFASKQPETAGALQGPQNPDLNAVCEMFQDIDPAYLPEFRALIQTMISNAEFFKEIRSVEKKFGIIKTKDDEQDHP